MGEDYSCDDYPDKIPGTTTDLECGTTLVGNIRPIFDTPGVTVTVSESRRSLTVGENGGTDRYEIRLNTQPTHPVTVTPQITPDDVVTIDTDSSRADLQDTLTFTPETDTAGGWNMMQTVTVTGVDNNIDHPANQMVTIRHRVESDDTLYRRLTNVGSVTVTAIDNDTAGVTIIQSGTPPSTIVAENGGIDSYTVVLNTEPTDEVTVTLTSDPTGVVTISPNSLTFDDANWRMEETVTLRGINNNVIHSVDDPTPMIRHAFSSSGDSVYDNLPDAFVTFTATDDDIDSDNDGTIDALDIDDDNDGLIEIHNLDMLENIGNNLAGTSYDDDSTDEGMTTDGGSSAGAPTAAQARTNCADRTAPNNLCGYELVRDLDFAIAAHYASGSANYTNNTWRPTTGIPPVLSNNPDLATNAGFNGFGAATGDSGGFTAIFEGNGLSIKNLYSRASNSGSRNVGLFRLLGSTGVIRNVGVTEANVYSGSGADNVAPLVGYNSGTIIASYATGDPDGGRGNDSIGGLVGYNDASSTIIASHAIGNADGGDGRDNVGGLVGLGDGGTIIASHATGNADGGDGRNDDVGGLVGENRGGTITASYATGNADGGDGRNDDVGGLVGENRGGTITASYATGNADGGDGRNDNVGGLGGLNYNGTITASYATGNADGGAETSDRVGDLVGSSNVTITANYAFGSSSNGEIADHNDNGDTLPGTVNSPHDFTATGDNSPGTSWNSSASGTSGAWDFGSNSQVPALVYADYDDSGNTHSCDNYPDKIPGTTITLRCGITNPSLVGNYRPAMVETPTFNLAAGNVLDTDTLTISTRTTGATIYYTTNGSNPITTGASRSSSGIAGSSSVTLSFGTVGTGMQGIRAIAVKADYLNSAIARRTFTVERDVDADDNGLIEIRNLDMLENIGNNLAGTNYKTSGSDPGSSAGAPGSRPSNCIGRTPTTNLCGYELAQDLDFAIATHYASRSANYTNKTWRPTNISGTVLTGSDIDNATNAGFNGFGAATGDSGGFTAIFEGNGHSIKNLYSRASNSGSRNVGLFRLLGSTGVIRNVEMIDVNVYGGSGNLDRVGGLVGYNGGGTITASYATGNADGITGFADSVGGLVGYNDASSTITASHATAKVNGGANNGDEVGGLVGRNNGTITASYAGSSTDGGDGNNDSVGGLVGYNDASGTITASYATGNANGGDGENDDVGGLVGYNDGPITASYAIGNANGGDGENDDVGGLVGESSSTITASYATGNANGGDGDHDDVGGLVGESSGTITASYAFGTPTGETTGHNGSSKPSGVAAASGLTASNTPMASWDSASRGTDGAWSFITNMNPALVYADYDDTGDTYSCDDYPEKIPGTTTDLICGTTLVGGYRSPVVSP